MPKTGRPRTATWTRQTCEQCGIEYDRPEWAKTQRRFHDRACYLQWWAAHRKPPKEPKPERIPQFCSMGDERPVKGRGLCEMHLKRFRKYGDPTIVRVKQPAPSNLQRKCSLADCDEGPVAGDGLCRKHYMRKYRYGDSGTVLLKGTLSTSMLSRTHMFVEGSPDECWEWKGSLNNNGYGITGQAGFMLAHRAVYMEMVGGIPDGLTLDHLCANRICVNPHHMDPCTPRENKFRGGEPHFELRGKAAHY